MTAERYGRCRPGILQCLAGFVLVCHVNSAWAGTEAALALALQGQYTRLQTQLQHNAFGRPLVLQSAESADGLSGDIYAVVAFPFATVSTGMRSPGHWCEVMMLHINTKYCRAVAGSTGTALRVNIGKKTPQPIAAAPRVELQYTETAVTHAYFAITLTAKDGPLDTSNYRIHLEAVELPDNQSFLHFTYAYDVGLVSRLAMKTYLATLGAGKVGFTQVGTSANGQPVHVAGMRGVVERNTMRYYLAIDSFLASLGEPPATQVEHRLNAWFDAVERYPRQLHEVDRSDYLEMKRAEVARQQAG
ncbi:hypothetical protein [Rhodoferax sp.]|uniref:hypothetical protein n=1 Tax=Rhodoferax sp. TaxID=50421 RepID=UPI002627E35C|nr:hypothetical protein [Rhodoferax sp.]MDD2919464.1 hypothetical protein [Rhodoferax sp.]